MMHQVSEAAGIKEDILWFSFLEGLTCEQKLQRVGM